MKPAVLQLDALSAFDDNYIWVLRDAARRAIVIDPGDAAPVLAADIEPVAILVTHHHADHIGGIARLRERWPRLDVFAPRDERIGATHRVGEGDVVESLGARFRVIETPGHTRSHVAYFDGERVFCGDTLFSLGCGRLFEGTPRQMLESLDKLASLPDVTKPCCAHEYTRANAAFAVVVDPGNAALLRHSEEVIAMRNAGRPTLPSSMALEKACNPFLRVDAAEVRARIAAHAGRELEDRVDAFAELRRWKDQF